MNFVQKKVFVMKSLLQGIFGKVKDGEILVVMGFSGLGKLILIDVLV